MPGRSRSATEERALERSGAMDMAIWPRDTVTWWKSRRPLRAPARSVTAKVPGIILYSTEAPPPKSLEVEPGRLVKMTDDIWIM